MGLKDNLDYIKGEVIGEGKVLDLYIKIEQFIKKKKKVVLSFTIALIASIVSFISFTVVQNNRISIANTALNDYLKDPSEISLKTIQDSNKYLYQLLKARENPQDQAILSKLVNSNFDLVKDIAKYQQFILNLDQDKFNAYSNVFLKDYANFNSGFYFLQKGDYRKAISYLNSISSESNLYGQVKYLKHYGIDTQ